jgi:membrane protein DedA with SNARE-associated domain
MKEFAIEMINNHGYLGILILTTIESILPIIPAEFILTIGGFATTVTEVTKGGVILFATLGELLGALVLYSIGYMISYERLEKLLSGKLSRITHLNSEDLRKSRDWFLLKGKYTVFFSKCIPVAGSLVAIPAGMAHMNLLAFIVLTLLGITVWNTVLVYFGATIKKCIDILLHGSAAFPMLLAVIFIVCFILVIVYYLSNKNVKEKYRT